MSTALHVTVHHLHQHWGREGVDVEDSEPISHKHTHTIETVTDNVLLHNMVHIFTLLANKLKKRRRRRVR